MAQVYHDVANDAEVADILLRKDAINFGRAYENAVAQELLAQRGRYWRRCTGGREEAAM